MSGKKKPRSDGAKRTKPPLPLRSKRKSTVPPARKKATGFSSLIRGVAEAAVSEEGIGAPIPKTAPPPRMLGSSLPEISIAHSPAGRDTLDAIAREMQGKTGVRVTQKTFGGARPPAASAPDITVGYEMGGRETLAAIERELAGVRAESIAEEPPTGVRHRTGTIPYDDQLKDPGRAVVHSAPEIITVEERPIGQTTLAAIAAEAANDAGEVSLGEDTLDDETIAAIAAEANRESIPDVRGPMTLRGVPEQGRLPVSPSRAPTPALEIHEVVTFVLRGIEIAELDTAEKRLKFVLANLMHRLPVWSPKDVSRIDVARSDDKSYVVIQVMCRLTPGGA